MYAHAGTGQYNKLSSAIGMAGAALHHGVQAILFIIQQDKFVMQNRDKKDFTACGHWQLQDSPSSM